MPNAIGGKHYKKGKGRKNRNPEGEVNEETGNDFYGVVTKKLGGDRLMVKLNDGTETQCIIPGKLYKRVWVNIGSYVHVTKDGDECELVRRIDDSHEKNKAGRVIATEDDPDNIFATQEDDDVDDDKNIFASLNRMAGITTEKKTQHRLAQKAKDLKIAGKRVPRVLKTSASDSESNSDSDTDSDIGAGVNASK